MNTILKKRIIGLILVLATFGSVYLVLEFGRLEVTREVSPLLMPQTVEIKLPFKPAGVTFDGEKLWFSSSIDDMIYGFNPTKNEIVHELLVPESVPSGITWDGQHLWFVDSVSLKIYKIDPTNAEILYEVDSPGIKPTGLAWDGSSLWVSDPVLLRVFHIDISDGSVLQEYRLPAPGSRPGGLSWKDEQLWIADMESSLILEFEPDNDKMKSYYYSPGYYPGGITWDEEYLWVTDYSIDKVFKTIPGERVQKIIPLSVPTWFWPVLLITMIPVVLSIISATSTKDELPSLDEKDKIKTTNKPSNKGTIYKIAVIIATGGAIYSGYELFRVIYSTTILNQLVIRGNLPTWLYSLEMILCLYTAAFWIYHVVVTLLIPFIIEGLRDQ